MMFSSWLNGCWNHILCYCDRVLLSKCCDCIYLLGFNHVTHLYLVSVSTEEHEQWNTSTNTATYQKTSATHKKHRTWSKGNIRYISIFKLINNPVASNQNLIAVLAYSTFMEQHPFALMTFLLMHITTTIFNISWLSRLMSPSTIVVDEYYDIGKL